MDWAPLFMVNPPSLYVPGDVPAGPNAIWMKRHGMCVKGIHHPDLIWGYLRKVYNDEAVNLKLQLWLYQSMAEPEEVVCKHIRPFNCFLEQGSNLLTLLISTFLHSAFGEREFRFLTAFDTQLSYCSSPVGRWFFSVVCAFLVFYTVSPPWVSLISIWCKVKGVDVMYPSSV